MAGTVNSWNNQINGSYNQIILNAGTNGVAISTDASAATVNVATGAAVKTATFGSTNSTSATTVQSGSGALNVTSTNGAMTINSGTGALNISSDASATTVNVGTGAASKVVTVGSTNTTSSLALKYGTADFTLASATGTVMSALDTGEITYPLQSAFLATVVNTISNVTGDGTFYTVIYGTEIFDQNSDYNNATGVFTAPVTGRYHFEYSVNTVEISAGMTSCLYLLNSSNATYRTFQANLAAIATGGIYGYGSSSFIDMDASDTVSFQIYIAGGTKIVDIEGVTASGQRMSSFAGWLVC